MDVRDCVLAASILSKTHKLIDPARTAIRGGSSGGFTVLAAACAYPDAFAAAVSNYGISDLFKLCEFTHKFESHYMEKLLGGTPDQIPEVYKERSPVFNADKIRTPLLVRRFANSRKNGDQTPTCIDSARLLGCRRASRTSRSYRKSHQG